MEPTHGDVTGRIPSFIGADSAAARLAEHPAWHAASVIKAVPDARSWTHQPAHAYCDHGSLSPSREEVLPESEHDFRVDLIVTQDETIECPAHPRPPGIIWEHLATDSIAAIPALENRKPSER
jgi:hypothetical protein